MTTTVYTTVADAVAEINRLLPVYDAACRASDELVTQNASTASSGSLLGKMAAAVTVARPTFPPAVAGVPSPFNRIHATSPTAVDGS